jgi:acyl-CoA synthetase (AMP-forming)/AMP-acid ligase II
MVPSTFNAVLARLDQTTTGITFTGGASLGLVPYAALAALVRGNAEHFASLGVTRGERVAIALESDLEHVVAFLALMALGAVPLSVKPRRGSIEEHARHLEALHARYGVRYAYATLPACAGVTAIDWSPSSYSSRAASVVEVGPEDLAFVQFSSGSLGEPKAVPIRHGSLMDNLASIVEVDGRSPDYLGYAFLPLSHDMGLVGGLLSNLLFQNDLVLSPVQHFLRRPIAVFAEHASHPRVGVAMPDFALRYLARFLQARGAGRDGRSRDERALQRLRTIYCGAEPISETTIQAVLDVAPSAGLDPSALVFSYGLAEATLLVTARSFGSLEDSFGQGPKARAIANVGRPRRGTEVRISSSGHVLVRGPGVCRGYLDEPARESEWLDTGDVGELRDGDLYVTGRAKELVIVNGENLFPGDIESFLSRMPGVAEPLVMIEDERFYVLVVPSRGAAVDGSALAACVANEFGVAASGIAVGAARHLLRTTSGKPMRAATLAELRSHGLLESVA